MANNKVELADGTVLIDLTDTTASAEDVAEGKYFYGADGVKTMGTASGSSPADYLRHYIFKPEADVRTVQVPIGVGRHAISFISNYAYNVSKSVAFAGAISINKSGDVTTASRLLIRSSSGSFTYYASNSGGGQNWSYEDGILTISNTSGWLFLGGLRYDFFWPDL